MANMYRLLADYCIRTSMFNLFYLSCLCIVYSSGYNVNDHYCALLSHKVVNLDTDACIETGQSSAL